MYSVKSNKIVYNSGIIRSYIIVFFKWRLFTKIYSSNPHFYFYGFLCILLNQKPTRNVFFFTKLLLFISRKFRNRFPHAYRLQPPTVKASLAPGWNMGLLPRTFWNGQSQNHREIQKWPDFAF